MNTIMFPRLTGICTGWVREHLEGLRFEEDEEDRFDEAFELMCRVGHGQH